MPITVNLPLDLDAHAREVEIVADPKDPAAGTVRVTLREIPHGKAKALFARRASAFTAYTKAAPAIEGLGAGTPLTTDESERWGEALHGLHLAYRELVRWGVCGHRAEDFINRGAAVPFLGEEASFLGAPYKVAAPLDLLLYADTGKRPGDAAGPLFNALVRAVEIYQEGKLEEPAEVWAKYEAP